MFEKSSEAVYVPEPEKALDVSGEKGIHPLAVEGRFFLLGQQGGRQSTMEQAALESRTKGLQFLQQNGDEVDGALAAGERVAEFFPGGEGG